MSVYDFDSLVNEILRTRPELSRETLMEKIEQKKNSIGAGYLTNQGALFLIAGELGVKLKPSSSSDVSIKDLHVGANDVNVVARVLSIYPKGKYRKKEGGEGTYRRLVLFDGEKTARLTIWDEGIVDIERLGLVQGVAIRVRGAYVKQGLDGKPSLNLGRRGAIEVVSDVEARLLPTLGSVTTKLTEPAEGKQYLALDCIVCSQTKKSDFVKSDGSPGSLIQFRVKGLGATKEYRVVIWNPGVNPVLSQGWYVRITNLRAKKSVTGEIELHGDAGSTITQIRENNAEAFRVLAVLNHGDERVIATIDERKRVKTFKLIPGQLPPKNADIIRVLHRDAYGIRIEVLDAVESLPSIESLTTKIKDLKDESPPVMLEVVALSHGQVADVQLKDGTVVKKGELVVGDETGEIKVVAWRDTSAVLEGIEPGERLRIIGVSPRATKMGGMTLVISNETIVERLRSG